MDFNEQFQIRGQPRGRARPAVAAPTNQPLQRGLIARDLIFGAFIYLAVSHLINAALAMFDYQWVEPKNKERQFWLIWFDLGVSALLFGASYLMIRLDPDNYFFGAIFEMAEKRGRRHQKNRSYSNF